MLIQSNMDFFDSISEFYDSMIDFDTALNRRKELLKKFIKTDNKMAADLGCGTGLDSIALASLGLKVTAFDLSKKMIEFAKENSIRAGFKVHFHKSSLDKINKSFYNEFDIVLSLGNTIANLNPLKLERAIKKIGMILKNDGKLIIQVLNYSYILKKNERIISIKSNKGVTFIRFYDFLPEFFNFNILKFKTDNPTEKSLFTTKIFPYDKNLFNSLLKQTGFKRIKFYGSLTLDKFVISASKDLIILAEK